jgi:recombination protein RecA
MAKKPSEKVASSVQEKPTDAKDKQRALMQALKSVQATFGQDAVFRGGDNRSLVIESISTGSIGLDEAIGIGGMARGRIHEIFGREGSGKTMLALSTIAQAQRMGGQAVFIDVEHALDPEWCKKLGVDFDKMIISQPNSGEEALDIMQKFVESNAVDVIVLDSVASLVSKAEIEGDMGSQHMGQTARLMSLALKKLTPLVSKSKVVCIFINQIREKIGVMYGNPETTPGGNALKFYSSIRLKAGKISGSEKKIGQQQIGHRLKIQLIKNKVATPFKVAEFDLYYNSGIDQKSEISSLAISKGVVTNPQGRTYLYKDYKWTSKAAFEEEIANDKKLAEQLLADVKEALKNKVEDKTSMAVAEQVLAGGEKVLVDQNTGEILDSAEEEE